MKIVCNCGEELRVIHKGDIDPPATDDCYCITEGDIRVWADYNIVGFRCNKCKTDKWINV